MITLPETALGDRVRPLLDTAREKLQGYILQQAPAYPLCLPTIYGGVIKPFKTGKERVAVNNK